MTRLRKRPPRLHEPGPPRLWKIGYALAACFAVAVMGLVGLWLAALALLNSPKLPHSNAISLHDAVGVAQLVFASVAGAGALVALVVAYRRQRVAETGSAHDRTRIFNERFTAIATQLGDDQAAVRLAGVHAMAGLADDWKENRQTCVDVLCAYLRIPYGPEPGGNAPTQKRLAYRADREVRHTITRLIGAHLRPEASPSWQGLDLDFTGAQFDGCDFSRAEFSGGRVNFEGAQFSGGKNIFGDTRFSGGMVLFAGAKFSGGWVHFSLSEFCGAKVLFALAEFSGADIYFNDAKFSGGLVDFGDAVFSGGMVTFYDAEFSGSEVSFSHAGFSGSAIDFSHVADWSHPPTFDWKGAPPAGVTLP